MVELEGPAKEMIMPATAKLFAILGSILAALAVIAGAFGAHALKGRLSAEMLAAFQTGVQYHFLHALGLFAVALVAGNFPASGLARWSGWSMLLGIVLFSGSLYLLTLTGIRGIGAITPLGGVVFILSWLLLAAAVFRG